MPDAPKYDILIQAGKFTNLPKEKIVFKGVTIDDAKRRFTHYIGCSDDNLQRTECPRCFILLAFNEGFTIGEAIAFKQ